MRSALLTAAMVICAGGALVAQTPSAASISPTSATVGQNSLTLFIYGANFTSSSSVFWNTTPLATNFLGPTAVSAVVPGSLLAMPGTFFVSVGSGSTRSNPLLFSVAGQPLVIASKALPDANAGVPYTFTLTATGGSPPFTWFPLTPLPPGLTLTPAGLLTGTPASIGSVRFDVRVVDALQGSATATIQLNVAAPPVSITTAALLPAPTGAFYNVTLAATGGTAPYSWGATGVPLGMSLDPKTGILSGTPTVKGNYRVTFQVSDANGTTATKQLTLAVVAPPLTISTSAPLFDATVGSAYAQTFTADGGTPPYTWAIASGSTGDLALDPSKGTLSGVPQNAGMRAFVLQVVDSAGVSASKSFSVNVGLPKITITTNPGLPGGKVGEPYSATLSATGGVAPYTWSADSNLTPGLSVTRDGVVTGTPTAPGTAAFSVQVTDSAGQTTRKGFSIVTTAAALVLTSAAKLPDAAVGQPYAFAFAAAGGVAPYTWSAAGLPDGLQLDGNGNLTGTPTTPGQVSFNVRVSDTTRAAAISLFQVNISMPALPDISLQGLPDTMDPASQASPALQLSAPYSAAITGQLTLVFAPDSGPGDGTIQFSTGGRTVSYSIPAGSTTAVLPDNLAIQSGTVAGTILVSASVQALGADITPATAPSKSVHVDAAAPAIKSVNLSTTSGGLQIDITGFCTAREIGQAKFSFGAASGSTLSTNEVTIPLDQVTSAWFADPANAKYGSQFTITQTFNINGNAGAVQLRSVTLTNRLGSTTYQVSQ